MNLKTKVNVVALVVAALLGAVLLIMRRCDREHKQTQEILTTVLTSSETKKIIVEPGRRSVSVVTKQGKETLKLYGNEPLSISEDVHGAITINQRKWGTELAPFVGLGVSDSLRGYFGLSLFYWRSFSLGLGISSDFTPPINGRAFGAVSLNVFRNTSLAVGVETGNYPFVGVTVRF